MDGTPDAHVAPLPVSLPPPSKTLKGMEKVVVDSYEVDLLVSVEERLYATTTFVLTTLPGETLVVDSHLVVRFHSYNLRLISASISFPSSTFSTFTATYDQTEEAFTLSFPLPPDESVPSTFSLTLETGGEVLTVVRTQGVFQVLENGEKVGFATQFEPCYARRVFPCLDEPARRAPFTFNLTVPSEYETVVSNGELIEKSSIYQVENSDGEYIKWKFKKTPPLPPYLVAFFAGNFGFKEDVYLRPSGEGAAVPLRMYAPVEQLDQVSYAMEYTKKALEFYERKTGVLFPWPKLDIIGVENFSSLGMENFGCMIFAKSYFLVGPDTPLDRRQRITRLIAHEVGHNWFGNVVNVETWDYLWLKEGFCRFLEYNFVDEMYPEWNYWRHFIASIYAPTMRRDTIGESHPVQLVVNTRADVESKFDLISYGKGASVLRMLSYWIGKDLMWDGVASLIRENSWGYINVQQFWRAFSVSGVDSSMSIPDLLGPWVTQANYPLVTVTKREYDLDSKKVTLTLSQSVFLDSSDREEFGPLLSTKWNIPLRIRCGGRPVQHILLTDSADSVTVEGSPDETICLNADHSGFYRVHYMNEMLEEMFSSIESGDLDEASTIGFAFDVVSLAKAGDLPKSDFEKLLGVLTESPNAYVWEVLSKSVHGLFSTSVSTPVSKQTASTVISLCDSLTIARTKEGLAQDPSLLSVQKEAIKALELANDV